MLRDVDPQISVALAVDFNARRGDLLRARKPARCPELRDRVRLVDRDGELEGEGVVMMISRTLLYVAPDWSTVVDVPENDEAPAPKGGQV